MPQKKNIVEELVQTIRYAIYGEFSIDEVALKNQLSKTLTQLHTTILEELGHDEETKEIINKVFKEII